MIPFQVQFEAWLRSFTGLAAFMQMKWSWPAMESAHFIGLTLLFGSIAAWDLRLVGALKEIVRGPLIIGPVARRCMDGP